ncbi:hypothetical protein GCM10020220_019350 [Nonomuraea rubra]|uniref:hypothetical protein n=1 Tax=Nonomuraea rubra TaxID=46180 RepID=UPI0031E8B22E
MTSTLIGLLLAARPAWVTRVQLRTAEDGDCFDLRHLTAALTLGDGDNDAEISEVEEYPAARLIVGRLSHPGDRPATSSPRRCSATTSRPPPTGGGSTSAAASSSPACASAAPPRTFPTPSTTRHASCLH